MVDVPENTRIDSVLVDPSTLAIARVYANAFLKAAGGNAADGLEECTSFLDDVLAAGQGPPEDDWRMQHQQATWILQTPLAWAPRTCGLDARGRGCAPHPTLRRRR